VQKKEKRLYSNNEGAATPQNKKGASTMQAGKLSKKMSATNAKKHMGTQGIPAGHREALLQTLEHKTTVNHFRPGEDGFEVSGSREVVGREYQGEHVQGAIDRYKSDKKFAKQIAKASEGINQAEKEAKAKAKAEKEERTNYIPNLLSKQKEKEEEKRQATAAEKEYDRRHPNQAPEDFDPFELMMINAEMEKKAEEAKKTQLEEPEEVISENTSTGKVIKVGDKVYKNTTYKVNGKKTLEGEVYDVMRGVPGISEGKLVERNGQKMIETPYYKHVVSIDTIPKDRRERLGRSIAPSIPLINKAINELSNKGYNYSDPLQFGVGKDGKLKLMDFSNVSKDEYATEDNYSRLVDFYKMFGLGKQADIIKTGINLRDLGNLYSEEDLKNGDVLMQSDDPDMRALMELKKVGDIPLNHAYYTTNKRMVQLKSPIAQTEAIDGIKYIYSEKPLSEKELDDWELKTIYNSKN
jgi:hypothetical protein